ncbi:MAG: NERD domain-containing protein [Clostridiales bacterium]|nr:NERD domain-containing protein [Clostridiales bacterium]
MVYIIGIALLVFLIVFIIQLKKAYINHEQKEIKYAGKKGELMFRDMILNILHSDDTLLNNINLNADGKQTEIDNLIINKNGIFIVEIKNYNGKLYGNADDYEWIKEKVSPGGKVFTKKVRNPIKQTKRQIYILSKYLKNNNIRIWIKGYTYFINNYSPVEDECVIKDIEELDLIIHEKRNKVYDEEVIHKAINLLSAYN